jgi:hypothetical protein
MTLIGVSDQDASAKPAPSKLTCDFKAYATGRTRDQCGFHGLKSTVLFVVILMHKLRYRGGAIRGDPDSGRLKNLHVPESRRPVGSLLLFRCVWSRWNGGSTFGDNLIKTPAGQIR